MASRYREQTLRDIEFLEQKLYVIERGMRNNSISAKEVYDGITNVVATVEHLKGIVESEPDVYQG